MLLTHTHMSTHIHSFTLQAIETYLMTALGAPPLLHKPHGTHAHTLTPTHL